MATPMGEPVFERYGCTKDDLKDLAFWSEEGWCSACFARDVLVGHVGIRGKASLGFCTRCLDNMRAATLLSEGPARE